jgi:predicted DsbA family dithiol-disulfide isomerase
VLDTFSHYAQNLGLETSAFLECLESRQFIEQVRHDVREGQQAGVGGTPTFVINGELLVGAHPFETFQRIIEAELQGKP